MGIKLTGSIKIQRIIDGKKQQQTILGSDFGIDEDGNRNTGDGDSQYEALFRYDEDGLTISLQATKFGNDVTMHSINIEQTNVIVINDDLNCEATDEDEDDFQGRVHVSVSLP